MSFAISINDIIFMNIEKFPDQSLKISQLRPKMLRNAKNEYLYGPSTATRV